MKMKLLFDYINFNLHFYVVELIKGKREKIKRRDPFVFSYVKHFEILKCRLVLECSEIVLYR